MLSLSGVHREPPPPPVAICRMADKMVKASERYNGFIIYFGTIIVQKEEKIGWDGGGGTCALFKTDEEYRRNTVLKVFDCELIVISASPPTPPTPALFLFHFLFSFFFSFSY